MESIYPESAFSNYIKKLVNAPWFNRTIIFLIALNGVVLGLETYLYVMKTFGSALAIIDRIILSVFVIELVLRSVAHKEKFFKDSWNLVDTLVVIVSIIPITKHFSVVRVFRVLRVLRLISAFPRMRNVVEGLLSAVPGITSIGALLLILFYVFAVVGTNLYGDIYPEWFGSLQISLFSLFQIMTLEGWPEIVREIMKTRPYSWIYFISYILIATFSVLNLFIAVIVEAVQKQHNINEENESALLIKLNEKVDELAKKINQLTP